MSKNYAIVRPLIHWEHYVVHKEFILHCDQQSLQFLNLHKILSIMHSRWALFLQKFSYLLKHKSRKKNVAADALSRRGYLLTINQSEFCYFETLGELCEIDEDFGDN